MIFDELARAHGDPESTYLAAPPPVSPAPRSGGAHAFRDAPERPLHVDAATGRPPLLSDDDGNGPVEDWSAGGDLDPTVPDPIPAPITDSRHPDWVAPWRPPGGA